MLRIEPYQARYLDEVRALDAFLGLEIACHKDVLPDSIFLAFTDRLIGAGFLMRNPFDRFVSLEYKTDNRTEAGIDAAAMLLAALTDRFLAYARTGHEKTGEVLTLRLWCREHQDAYRGFLEEFGFRASDRMLVMQKDTGHPGTGSGEGAGPEHTQSSLEELRKTQVVTNEAEGLRIPERCKDMTESIVSRSGVLDHYLSRNKAAFGYQDSPDELLFRILYCGGRVFAAYAPDGQGEQPVSFVTVWPAGEHTSATENIFCDPAYQRRGYTGTLLKEIFHTLGEEGYTSFRLNVYENDTPAICLYRSLGYQIRYRLLEMHYTGGEGGPV